MEQYSGINLRNLIAVSPTVFTAMKRVVEDYTGETVDKVLVSADPRVSGTYAIRATFKGQTVDFLYAGYKGGLADPKELEEVEFNSWPPVSR